MRNSQIKEVLAFTLQMACSYKASIAVMFWVAIFWATDLSLRPYILKVILNKVTSYQGNDLFHHLAISVGLYLLLSFIMTASFRLYGYFVEIKMIPRMRQKVGSSAIEYLLNQSHHFYQNTFAGSLANKVNDLTGSIPTLIQIFMDRFFSHALALIIAIFTLWHVNYKFALALFTWVALFMGTSLVYMKRIHYYSDSWSEAGATITGKVVDSLSNILSVRLFSRQRKEKNDIIQTMEKAVIAEQSLQWYYFYIWCLYGFSFVILQAVVLYFLIDGRQQGVITVGDFALVLVINIAIVDFLWNLTKEISEFTKQLGKATQALRTITVPIEIEDVAGAVPLQISQGEIQFKDVQFYYEGADILFENKTVTILPGQKVGLVGYSGSGKSTFVNLILRMFEVNQGSILIDQQNIQKVTQTSLREAIAMIPQDPSLFHQTLMDNIRYGRLEATDEEVIEAAKKAHAHEFISVIPKGYNALVGERGVKLSGGQRQRIAIARAILKNAPILILDEATSQLDSVTENYIQDSLWELMQNKTTLIIAHRLSTLLRMDRILVFDKGKIVQDGTHEELSHEEGLYKTLWDAQVGGFLPNA